MKTSELIKKLESLLEKHGDKELEFGVKDYYSTHFEYMSTNLKCGETTNLPTDWSSVFTNGNKTRIEFSLNMSFDGKKPKITYRS